MTARSLTTVAVTVAETVVSATLVAVTLTVAGKGKSAGAVYAPAAEMVPAAALPPTTPFTLQTTAVFAVFVTVAVKLCGFPKMTEALPGETLTTIAGGLGAGGGEGGEVTTDVTPAPPPHACE